jgi:hypothetical protein
LGVRASNSSATRQTAGNVAGLLAFDRDTGQHFAGAHVLAVAHLDQRADLEADGHRVVGARDLDFLAVGVDQLDLRTHDLGRAAALGVDHHQGGQAGHLVDLLGHGHAFLDVLELHRPAYSVMIGRVSGSQLARMVPALMVWSALTVSVAP